VVVHLLAPRTVEALEQGGDDPFLDGEFRFERSDFRGQAGNLFGGRFDVSTYSRTRAITRSGNDIY
jgi:hypothetical protein